MSDNRSYVNYIHLHTQTIPLARAPEQVASPPPLCSALASAGLVAVVEGPETGFRKRLLGAWPPWRGGRQRGRDWVFGVVALFNLGVSGELRLAPQHDCAFSSGAQSPSAAMRG